jgi:hypothetical protein
MAQKLGGDPSSSLMCECQVVGIYIDVIFVGDIPLVAEGVHRSRHASGANAQALRHRCILNLLAEVIVNARFRVVLTSVDMLETLNKSFDKFARRCPLKRPGGAVATNLHKISG